MNAQDWLEQATKEMPDAVRRRVQAETLAHLEDAGVGEGADVRAVLGEPKAMRRELGRLYVPDKRLRGLIEQNFFGNTYVVPILSLGPAFSIIRSDPGSAYGELLGWAALIVLSLWLSTPFLTRRLSPVRRRFWGSAMGLATGMTNLWLYQLSDVLSGTPIDIWDVVPLILWPYLVLATLWNAWHEDRRLSRTLALVGGAQL